MIIGDGAAVSADGEALVQLALGHRTVWHVAGPDDSFAAARRAAAWREQLSAAGREIPAMLHGDWSAESGYAAGLRLAREPGATAVFVANDQMALGVLRAFREEGISVPGDMSVVGFDDTPETACYPPQDFGEVGRQCLTKVLSSIRGEGPDHGTTLVPTRLVVRSSTAPPPS